MLTGESLNHTSFVVLTCVSCTLTLMSGLVAKHKEPQQITEDQTQLACCPFDFSLRLMAVLLLVVSSSDSYSAPNTP